MSEKTPETYTFEYNGESYTIPKFKKVKSGIIRKTRHLDPADAMYSILESIASEEALAATDEMDMDELEKFMEEWQEDSGVSLGESEH